MSAALELANHPRIASVKRGRPARAEDRYTDKSGYVHVRIAGRFWPEHRIVMMALLGRPLVPGESVHHRNGQRGDNRPSNLELWVGPIRRGARATDLVCLHCGTPWLARTPRRPVLALAEVAARIRSGQWSGPSDALSGFFERFRKSAALVAGGRDRSGGPGPGQAVLWEGAP
jgi:hypothetical protein